MLGKRILKNTATRVQDELVTHILQGRKEKTKKYSKISFARPFPNFTTCYIHSHYTHDANLVKFDMEYWCNILTCTIFPNPRAHADRYAVCAQPPCVLENGVVSECYTVFRIASMLKEVLLYIKRHIAHVDVILCVKCRRSVCIKRVKLKLHELTFLE